MRKTACRHENGVALIFALGLLTLLSVLGVAFVTNSLTAQKIAVNVGARNQARILMDSAINRVMITLMGVFSQSPGGTGDFSCIYSAPGGKAKGGEGTTWDQLDDYSGEAPKNELEDSKLSVVVTAGLPKYDGSKSKASWVYVHDADGYVIGRMAYQVLPTGLSSMSLDQVLLGVYNHDDTPGNTNFGSTTSPSWNVRIGKDITEFNIGKACGADAPFKNEWMYGTSGIYDAAQFPENIYTGAGYSRDNPFRAVASFDSFFGGVMYQNVVKNPSEGMDEKQQAWFRHWFSESNEASPEVFYTTGDKTTPMEQAVPYHRFNVGRISGVTDADDDRQWYSRFKGWDKDGFKNGSDAVKALTADSADFVPEDKAAPAGSGLPFLRAVGDTPGSFGAIADRRRQIAANLNDYCDKDSVPTSDVPAAEWSIDKMPSWTGNEKTPYINELALELKFDVTPVEISSNSNRYKFKVLPKVTPKLLAEIIDIYGVSLETGFNRSDFKCRSWMGNEISYTVSIKASGSVTYKQGGTDQVRSFTDVPVTHTITPPGPGSSVTRKFKVKLQDDGTVVSDADLSDFSGGYAVASKACDKKESTDIETGVTEPGVCRLYGSTVRSALGLGSVTIQSMTVSSLTMEISKIEFNIGALCLRYKDGGVDFVKGPAGTITAPDTVTLKVNWNGSNGGESSNGWNYLYVTGLEARDPRQNLNFNKARTTGDFKADASDWKCIPKLEKGSGSELEFEGGSMTVGFGGSSFTYTGNVNSCSNPSAPFSAEDKFSASAGAGETGTNYDSEKVADPAWKGDGITEHMSTAYIRNAPMQSLWELGAIHRASAWETINIKCSAVAEGSSARRMALSDFTNTRKIDGTANGIAYQDGDAGLLDQVKLTSKAYSSGKLNVNMLCENPNDFGLPATWNRNIAKALFFNIAHDQQIGDLFDKTKIGTTGTKFTNWSGSGEGPDLNTPAVYLTRYTPESDKTVPKGRADSDKNAKKFVSRADFVEGYGDPKDARLASEILATGFGLVTGWGSLADAQQEEIIGKTANLLTAGASTPTTIQAVVVVQTINPLTAPVDTNIVRQIYTGSTRTEKSVTITSSNQKTFKFDRYVDGGKTKYVYFDEITGELRALVTIKLVRDSDGTMRFQLYNVRYL